MQGQEPTPPTPAPGVPERSRVQGIFARIAPGYDRVNHVASLGIDHLWRRRTVRLAELGPESEVLDLAAGTGDLTLALAQHGSPARIVSTDFVPEMLEIGRKKAEGHAGPTRIEFQPADAQALPFPDGSFDAVTIAFGVRNLPDRAANFREVLRVLRPGGRYVILEFSKPAAPVRGLYYFYLRHVVPFWGGLLTGDKAAYEYLNDSIHLFPGQQALAGELKQAGFRDVSWEDLTFGVVAVHVARK